MPRLAQPKSKRGCRRCKQRKVKCDEVHPTCGACERHGSRCEYDVTFVVTNPGQSSRSRSRTGEPKRSNSGSPATTSQEGSISPSAAFLQYGNSRLGPTQPSGSDGRDRLQELRLLHHYTAFTCNTFLSLVAANVWRDVVPQLGFEHQFVLDMIFSLSALHLSRLHPENPEYLYANTDYYNRALQGHRSCVNNVDASNAEAVLATTVMIAFQSFVALGTHGGDQSSPTPYELPLQWLKLSSGTRTLYSTCMPHIMARGRLAGLFEDASSIVNETIFLDPTNLESLNAYVRWDLDALTLTNEDLIAYNETFRLVASIHQAIRGQQNPRITWRRITTIPAHAPVRFIDMIEERQPRALAILGHMFALMALVEGDRWWFAGITQHQINGISSLLAPEWHPLMFAPVQNLQEYASDFTW